MFLFFTGARIVFFGRTLKTLPEGHAILMRYAFAQVDHPHQNLIILGNQRADVPRARPDGTISLFGIFDALIRAQLLPKYHHGMRQIWHHPTKTLPRVQLALYRRFMRAITESNPTHAAELFGQALHTLQDTYTIGHTGRENNADVFSPMVRLHYSPSQAHPFISPNDTVWADESNQILSPPAQAAIQATVAALELWQKLWPATVESAKSAIAHFVNQYTPIRGHIFSPPDSR